MVTTPKVVAIQKPRSSNENQAKRFFDHAFSSIPTHAQIISTRVVSSQSKRSVTFTYRLDGSVVTESFNMGGQQS